MTLSIAPAATSPELTRSAMSSVPAARPGTPQTTTPQTTASALTRLALGHAARLASRGLRLRCPHCGPGAVLAPWPVGQRVGQPWGTGCTRGAGCDVRFDRREVHDAAGAMLVSVIIAERFVAVSVAVASFATWPAAPWAALTYGAAAGMRLVPLLCDPAATVLGRTVDVIRRAVSGKALR